MRICLVSMPWSYSSRPSAALASLAPYLRQNCADVSVDTEYAYLDVALRMGMGLYDAIAESFSEGELFYAGCVYPEKRASVISNAVKYLETKALDIKNPGLVHPKLRAESTTYTELVPKVLELLEEHVEQLGARLAQNVDILGLTTCFGQLYANLLLARKVKALNPNVIVTLGGSTVSGAVGPSVMKEYDAVDYIVQGEGELAFAALVNKIAGHGDCEAEPKGVLSRANVGNSPKGVPLWEVANMDDLPTPDYSGYVEKAREANIFWMLPVEGSRGCWWDRGKRTKNPKSTCFFCNLNVQWNGYREKSVERLAREVDELSERHSNPMVFFLDNIMRTKGIEKLADSLKVHNRDYVIFYELRAHMDPYDLVCLWEAGLSAAQFGIESLSSSYLRRIGKGTTAIQNLQAMKTCYELGITNEANLMTHFPGASQAEVEENCATILRYAFAYQPLRVVPFGVGIGSTVDTLASEFGVTNVRNADFWRLGLPDEVYSRMSMFDLSADYPTADWKPLLGVVEAWGRAYAAGRASKHGRIFTYLDGTSYLKLFDVRSGSLRMHVLRGVEREIYMECMQLTPGSELRKRWGKSPEEASSLRTFTNWAKEHNLMYEEDDKFLSLAPAARPDVAAARIRAANARRRTAKATANEMTTKTSDVGGSTGRKLRIIEA